MATILAATPMLLGFVGGVSAVIAGQELSSESSDWDGSGSDWASDFEALGDGSAAFGAIMAMICGFCLLAAISMAGGKTWGRVVTAVWLVLFLLLLLIGMADSADGALVPYYLLVLAPPVLALLGMFTSASNKVFRDT